MPPANDRVSNLVGGQCVPAMSSLRSGNGRR
jgi:hypothetical protein